MAEKAEKSNFALILGVAAALSITLVLMLKADEVKHLELKGASTTLESNAAALHEVKRFKNDFTEEN
ncbi:MAG: hypothetical protein ACKE51_04055 [Methylococcaceae bacterium]